MPSSAVCCWRLAIGSSCTAARLRTPDADDDSAGRPDCARRLAVLPVIRIRHRRQGSGDVHERGHPDRTAWIARDSRPSRSPVFRTGQASCSTGRNRIWGTKDCGSWASGCSTRARAGSSDSFPHLFPSSIAIGYGLLRAVGRADDRRCLGHAWACWRCTSRRTRFVGRPAAFAAAVLLSLHVIQVWFARYPNAEVVMQAMLFAAHSGVRAGAPGVTIDSLRPVAGALVGLLLFLRYDSLLAIAGIFAAAILAWVVDRKPPRMGVPAAVRGGGRAELVLSDGTDARIFLAAAHLPDESAGGCASLAPLPAGGRAGSAALVAPTIRGPRAATRARGDCDRPRRADRLCVVPARARRQARRLRCLRAQDVHEPLSPVAGSGRRRARPRARRRAATSGAIPRSFSCSPRSRCSSSTRCGWCPNHFWMDRRFLAGHPAWCAPLHRRRGGRHVRRTARTAPMAAGRGRRHVSRAPRSATTCRPRRR